MKIYQILPNLYLGQVLEVPDNQPGIPLGYTRTIAPDIQDGQFAVWQGTQWSITTTPPVPVVEEIL